MTLTTQFESINPTEDKLNEINATKIVADFKQPFNVEDITGKPLFAAAFIVSPETTAFKPLVDMKPIEIIIDPTPRTIEQMQRFADTRLHRELGYEIKDNMKVKNEKGNFVKKGAFSHVQKYSHFIQFFNTEAEATAYYKAIKGIEITKELERADKAIKLAQELAAL